jgi:hypothetical protein
MKKHINILLFCALLLCSCIKIAVKGTKSNYKSLSPEQIIRSSEKIICEQENPKTASVFIINGNQLSECLKKTPKALVYIWSPRCKGSFCYSPSYLQTFCNDNKIDFFFVIEYIDPKFIENQYGLNRPIFGIDTTYYKTDKVDRYKHKFYQDLSGQKKITNRILYFEDGKFIKSISNIDDL